MTSYGKSRLAIDYEIGAVSFHIYGNSYEDAHYILDAFPIVRKNPEKAQGDYRTKRVILEIPHPRRSPPADLRAVHPYIGGSKP